MAELPTFRPAIIALFGLMDCLYIAAISRMMMTRIAKPIYRPFLLFLGWSALVFCDGAVAAAGVAVVAAVVAVAPAVLAATAASNFLPVSSL